MTKPIASPISSARTGAASTAKPTVTVKVTAMATMAVTLSRTVNPRPARQSRTMGPKTRWSDSQLSNRSDEIENRKAASNTGPVVGTRGMTTPANPIPTNTQPSPISTTRSARLSTNPAISRTLNAAGNNRQSETIRSRPAQGLQMLGNLVAA